jgi:hypothetical protein
MGRFRSKKTIDSQCGIDIRILRRWGWLKEGFRGGTLRWSQWNSEAGSVNLWIRITPEYATIQLKYTYTDSFNGEKESFDYPVELVSTSCNYGGLYAP